MFWYVLGGLVLLAVVIGTGMYFEAERAVQAREASESSTEQKAPPAVRNVEWEARVLAEGPVGVWRSSQGTFNMIMSSVYRFFPDGTARTDHYSGSGDWAEVYRWRMAGPGHLQMAFPDIIDDEADPDDDSDAGPEEKDDRGDRELWGDVWLEFRDHTVDAGYTHRVLVEAGKQGYGFMDHPLAYAGPVSDEAPESVASDDRAD